MSILPNIIIETTSFFKQQGYATYCRCRKERGCSSGVTFEQIRTHLSSRVARLRQHTASLPTITRMFHPPDMINVIWVYSTQFPLAFQFLMRNKSKVRFANFLCVHFSFFICVKLPRSNSRHKKYSHPLKWFFLDICGNAGVDAATKET